ncbi:zinc finger CCCH domain-containing protein 18-like isoform X1 [Primulina huaijiensis]|uniref:zinc finger CCCH domain-containing protein 18-like isoform X1 n=1 Tax=Primulina huaijiensis TaxID=1492673 RepID=UPI003CC6F846
MDSSEAAKVVHDRILKLEPEHVARKIIGYVYLQELPDQEMIRLALGPDTLIHNLINTAKNALHIASAPLISPSISPTMSPNTFSDSHVQFSAFSPPTPHPFSAPFRRCWDPRLASEQQPIRNMVMKVVPYPDSIPEEYGLQNQLLGLEEAPETVVKARTRMSRFLHDYYCPEGAFGNLCIRGSRNSHSIMDYPVKTCHYFNKGFCKHGSSCRYVHDESFPESYTHMFGPSPYEVPGEDQVFLPGSLEKLELEIAELLRSRNGNPVSIASLPMMYYENYGKTLQAEGYLTESQRHGKAGYSLTKLLTRLKNSIRVIDRPHGQHAVVLAEDAPKYMDPRHDPGQIVSGSRQIYMTFPAESTFTEEDVSSYFNTFGPVQDVRIPCQQKRMFGFVTFSNVETVMLILSKGNPHYVSGARVLVKPYREKSKLVERKYIDKFDPLFHQHSRPIDYDPELQARWESSRLFRKQLMEEHEHALELETMRLSQLQFYHKPVANQAQLSYSTNKPKFPEDQHPKYFPSTECYNYLLDVLNSTGSTSDDNLTYAVNICSEHDSAQGLNLPDSPFASAVSNSIPAVI